MKKLIILHIILISILLSACSTEANSSGDSSPLYFDNIYSHIIGFSNAGNSIRRAPEENIYIFHDLSTWSQFRDTYFLNELPISDFSVLSNNKCIVYLQIDGSSPLAVAPYKIQNITLKDDTISVLAARSGSEARIHPVEPDTCFKYVVIAAVEKNQLPPEAIAELSIINERIRYK
jgi:hypothetical protein